MAAIVFWFVILPLAIIVLLAIVIKIVIPGLLFKTAGAAQGALDRKFERDYQIDPVSDQKMQSKMRQTFFSGWAMQILGVLFVALPVVYLIREGEMYLTDFMPYLLVGAFGIVLILIGVASMRRTKQLAVLIAEPIIREIFGTDSHYDARGHIPDECIAQSAFVEAYDRIYGSDFVQGHYRGVPVMFSDVRLVRVDREYNSETRKHEEHEADVFKGYWLVADFAHELAAQPLTVLEGRAGGDSIQMESEAFNRKFGVFCADEHTAFYILTPHFMERLMTVDEIADGKSCFHIGGNRLQIAVQTNRDLFEVKIFKAPDVITMREQFRREIGYLTTVLDEMLDHERLFTKG